MGSSILGFNGERLDPVSGTTHLGNGYRAYNPVLMRFNCPDSMSPFSSGGINPYVYCTGDPVNRDDPSGHFSLGQWIGMAVGLVAGIALSIVTEGAATPAVVTLMATMAHGAAIGAVSELTTEALDGQRINWASVGISAGIGAAALAGLGVGKGVSKAFGVIKGSISRANKLATAFNRGLSPTGEDVARASAVMKGEANVLPLDILSAQEREFFNLKKLTTKKYVGTLYRGDTRPPEVVMQQGFTSKGLNGDIMAHLLAPKNSHFISFTKSRLTAGIFARGRAYIQMADSGAKNGKFYVYEIDGLDYAVDLKDYQPFNEEVAAVGYVPPDKIVNAYETELTLDDD